MISHALCIHMHNIVLNVLCFTSLVPWGPLSWLLSLIFHSRLESRREGLGTLLPDITCITFVRSRSLYYPLA